MNEQKMLDGYESRFLGTAYAMTTGLEDRVFDPEAVAQAARNWTAGSGAAYARRLERLGLVQGDGDGRFRFTDAGKKVGWAHEHEIDVTDNLALLTKIYSKAYGRTAAVVDATAAGKAIGLHGSRLKKLLGWLDDKKLVMMLTPRDFEPARVKLRKAGRDRVKEADSLHYWFTNNQSVGAGFGVLIGALLNLLPKEATNRWTAIVASVLGILVGSIMTVLMLKLPARAYKKALGWVGIGVASVVLIAWGLKAEPDASAKPNQPDQKAAATDTPSAGNPPTTQPTITGTAPASSPSGLAP